MKTVEEIKAAIEAAVPGAAVSVVPNPSPAAQHSLLLKHDHAIEVATFLRDSPELAFDFLSNVTGVDWLDKEIAEKVKVTRQVKKTVDGVEQTVRVTWMRRRRVSFRCRSRASTIWSRRRIRACGPCRW